MAPVVLRHLPVVQLLEHRQEHYRLLRGRCATSAADEGPQAEVDPEERAVGQRYRRRGLVDAAVVFTQGPPPGI
jgi:hypothetical protein